MLDARMVVPIARMGKVLMFQWTEMCLAALVVLILLLHVLVPVALILMLSPLAVLDVLFLEMAVSRRLAMQHADQDQRHPNRSCVATMLHGATQFWLLCILQL